MNKLKILLLVPLLLLYAGGANSALVDFTLVGEVTVADTGNGFGLAASDTITVTGAFDDSALSGTGNEYISFGAGSGNSLSFDAGSVSFTQADDVDFGAGLGPNLMFSNGSFSGFDFLAEFGLTGSFSSVDLLFDAGDDSFYTLYVTGSWTSYTVSAVPVPAAVWLFGSGLLGLVGVARRRR